MLGCLYKYANWLLSFAVWASRFFLSPPHAADDTNLLTGFDIPDDTEKTADDEFDPIPVLVSKNSQGKKREDVSGYKTTFLKA